MRVGYALDVIAKTTAWTLLMTPLEQVSLLVTPGRSVGNFSVFSVNHCFGSFSPDHVSDPCLEGFS